MNVNLYICIFDGNFWDSARSAHLEDVLIASLLLLLKMVCMDCISFLWICWIDGGTFLFFLKLVSLCFFSLQLDIPNAFMNLYFILFWMVPFFCFGQSFTIRACVIFLFLSIVFLSLVVGLFVLRFGFQVLGASGILSL